MTNVVKGSFGRPMAGYIEIEQCDLDFEAELRAAYAINGPVVSMIAEFREEIAARAQEKAS